MLVLLFLFLNVFFLICNIYFYNCIQTLDNVRANTYTIMLLFWSFYRPKGRYNSPMAGVKLEAMHSEELINLPEV